MNSILFIRRDNIGDLLCTTPLIRAVRERFPEARIGILVNSYNVDAVSCNPDIDAVHVYRKAKHHPEENRLAVWWGNRQVMKAIRSAGYEVAIACGTYSKTLEKYALSTGAKRQIGFAPRPGERCGYSDPIEESMLPEHEVCRTARLLLPLGIDLPPGPMHLRADTASLESFLEARRAFQSAGAKPLAAVAISARVEKHRWPLDRFREMITRVLALGSCDILLLWAPGSRDNPTFPGDDEAAAMLIEEFGNRILPYRATELKELIAALAGSDLVVTLDTGSLHMSAALGKPTVALMRTSNIPVWGPWQTAGEVVQAENMVTDISVEEVLAAVDRTLAKLGARG